jgi:hypothetical protein
VITGANRYEENPKIPRRRIKGHVEKELLPYHHPIFFG